MNENYFLIVGLGLMGGSYAKALKKKGFYVMAVDNNPDSIKFALDNGIIDEGSCEPDPALLSKADVVIFALYPKIFKEWIAANQKHFRSGILITDVTGIKTAVVYDVQKILRDDIEYIPAHPMAGREVCGVQNSDDNIFTGANYIVVPTEKNSQRAIEWCKYLGALLGFRKISILTPEEHDNMIAYVSQLTHVIAVSLMTCSDNHEIVNYTGDSFRDLTRIARINDEMWSELFLMNKDALLNQIDLFSGELQELRQMIVEGDREGIRKKMRTSTERRSWFEKK